MRIRLEYSEDGEVWKVCSVFGDTVIGSSRFSGSITWLSRVDLPDTFGIVYFGVIPYDRDEGRFDSILVRLDNMIPGLTVNPIVGEVSGDVDIVVANEDLNTVSIFRNDGGLNFLI